MKEGESAVFAGPLCLREVHVLEDGCMSTRDLQRHRHSRHRGPNMNDFAAPKRSGIGDGAPDLRAVSPIPCRRAATISGSRRKRWFAAAGGRAMIA